MFHLKINDKIKNLLKESELKFGCVDSCPDQLIPFDEFQLMIRSLGNKITPKEAQEIQNSTSIYRLTNLHICKVENKEEDDNMSDGEIERQLKTDKIARSEEPGLLKNAIVDYKKIELEQKIIEENKSSLKSQTEEKENTVTFGFNMIGSFLLIVLGAYYLGKYYFEMEDQNTYKLVLVITIIVIIAEGMLLILKLNKYSKIVPTSSQIENSFAYRFNKSYRNKFNFPRGKRIFY